MSAAFKRAAIVLGVLLALMPPPACGERRHVADDEAVQLFTTTANLDADGRNWQVPVHGWIFEPERGSWWRAAVNKGVLDLLELSSADPGSGILQRRLEMFLADNERGKVLTVRVDGRPFAVGPSGPDGHFETRAALARASVSSASGVSLRISAADGREFFGRAQLLDPCGLSVISDIDDTVKVSQVTDKRELLANTFLREFTAVPGMAAAYRRWAGQGAAFHYVSASPWQLYAALDRFLGRAGFPRGELRLRRFRVKDRHLFTFMTQSRAFKTRTIHELVDRFPRRAFILVGDSGENDPAIYAEIARSKPKQVIGIYIRLVAADADHRQQAVAHFRGLPASCWHLFITGRELEDAIAVAGSEKS